MIHPKERIAHLMPDQRASRTLVSMGNPLSAGRTARVFVTLDASVCVPFISPGNSGTVARRTAM